MTPYYQDDHVTLYQGDMRHLLGELGLWADAIITDPPYGETTLKWDSWPYRWPSLAATHSASMWCFGSFRTFTDHWEDFTIADWEFSQEVVWEKHNGSGFAADRFKRVHELAVFFYQGNWASVYHEAVRETQFMRRGGNTNRNQQPTHAGQINGGAHDDDSRLARSVIRARSMHGRAIHPTEKPAAILDPLIRYSVPVGGLVLDPFAGSGSTLLTARTLGRKAIGIEADERYCEAAARRLSIPDLFGGVAS